MSYATPVKSIPTKGQQAEQKAACLNLGRHVPVYVETNWLTKLAGADWKIELMSAQLYNVTQDLRTLIAECEELRTEANQAKDMYALRTQELKLAKENNESLAKKYAEADDRAEAGIKRILELEKEINETESDREGAEARADTLEYQEQQLRNQLKHQADAANFYSAHNRGLMARNKVLADALGFYVDPATWKRNSAILKDRGAKAKEAITDTSHWEKGTPTDLTGAGATVTLTTDSAGNIVVDKIVFDESPVTGQTTYTAAD